jgi:hypothetical protein
MSNSRSFKQIVIVGGGPIGLYTAIRLHYEGVKNIQVIDPRIGTYIRPGRLNSDTLDFFDDGKGNLLFDPAKFEVAHLKDIERLLYKYAEERGIAMFKKKFVGFADAHHLQVEDAVGEISLLACDLIFDCSGSSRVVVHAINQKVSPEPFHIIPIAANPVPNQLLAYVKMSQVHADICKSVETIAGMSLTNNFKIHNRKNYFTTLEKLYVEFGWESLRSPEFYLKNYGKDKVCIYCDAPDNLEATQQDSWLKAVIEHKTGRSDITYTHLNTSKKYGKKPNFGTFKVDPHAVREFFYEGDDDLPKVFLLGDSQIDSDYRIGVGLESAVRTIKCLLEFTSVQAGQITGFDERIYCDNKVNLLVQHGLSLNLFYSSIENKYSPENLTAAIKYYVSQVIDPDPEEIRLISIFITFLAKEIEADAKQFITAKDYLSAGVRYEELKDLCVNSPSYLGDELKVLYPRVYSNLVLVCKLKSDFNKCISIADEAISNLKNFPHAIFEAKIIFNKVDAALKLTEKVRTDFFGKSRAHYYLQMSLPHMLYLLSSSNVSSQDYSRLQKRMAALSQQYQFPLGKTLERIEKISVTTLKITP